MRNKYLKDCLHQTIIIIIIKDATKNLQQPLLLAPPLYCTRVSRGDLYSSSPPLFMDTPLVASTFSNASSSLALVPTHPLKTCPAHSKYSCTRSSDHLTGGEPWRSRKLYNLSANLTSLASLLFLGAVSTCSFFLFAFGRDLSSVTSATTERMAFPKFSSISSIVVSVSSTVS